MVVKPTPGWSERRVVQLNPAYFAGEELKIYLARLAEADIELRKAVRQLRRRPRQAGKTL